MAVLMVVLSIPMGAARVGLVSTDVLIEDAQADGDRARVLSFLGHDRLPSTKKPKPARHPFGPILGPGQSRQDADDP